MLRLLSDITDFKIEATDGEIGKVKDFYFDDLTFNIRYLVIDAGTWLSSNKVLVSPDVVTKTNYENKHVEVNLTRDLVKHSPPFDSAKPISKEHEENMAEHYDWPLYWTTIDSAMFGAVPLEAENVKDISEKHESLEHQNRDYTLRSCDEIIGYTILAKDGEIGDVEDFIIEDELWSIRYIIVDTGSIFPGKKVLVAIPWIGKIEWNRSVVHIDLTKLSVKNSPEFDPEKVLKKDYEEKLFNHYDKPKYWEK